ncbi:Nuclear factor related to kappa-B-binding protein [Trichinella nelsoni]|uniref:Nuclear factor related to kappa-B-binding protein n=1 Tax=Trichinella nelsoni TaxID=6336 RepID=A0A0V0SBW4_9BILA|nr:Nuclear factor related to kappa-B-binding protein [Trichinella nelsoni]
MANADDRQLIRKGLYAAAAVALSDSVLLAMRSVGSLNCLQAVIVDSELFLNMNKTTDQVLYAFLHLCAILFFNNAQGKQRRSGSLSSHTPLYVEVPGEDVTNKKQPNYPFLYNDISFDLPYKWIRNDEAFFEIVSFASWKKLSNEQKKHLRKFLPKFADEEEEEQIVRKILDPKCNFYFGSPLKILSAVVESNPIPTFDKPRSVLTNRLSDSALYRRAMMRARFDDVATLSSLKRLDSVDLDLYKSVENIDLKRMLADYRILRKTKRHHTAFDFSDVDLEGIIARCGMQQYAARQLEKRIVFRINKRHAILEDAFLKSDTIMIRRIILLFTIAMTMFIFVRDPKLHEHCQQDDDYRIEKCADKHTVCANGTCVCKHLYKEKDGACIYDAKKLMEPCDHDRQCTTPFTQCYQGLCHCRPGFFNISGTCKPSKYYCPYGKPLMKGNAVHYCKISYKKSTDDCPAGSYCVPISNWIQEGNCREDNVIKEPECFYGDPAKDPVTNRTLSCSETNLNCPHSFICYTEFNLCCPLMPIYGQ